MTLLIPLGLLGLLGIVALIIIYIIRPNFQQKFVSSTYVWKLSLKYKKKRIPISKLRNLLIILCQILILVSCALILSKPALILKEQVTQTEIIAIIDSSASMRTSSNGETRFQRAVSETIDLTEDVLGENDGILSVIVSATSADFLVQRATAVEMDDVLDKLDELLTEKDACSYGTADIDSALGLCEEILEVNPSAQIYLYTDVTYSYVPDNIKVVSVADDSEWNAAILDAKVEREDNYYSFSVDVACYGRDMDVELTVSVYNANASDSTDTGSTISFSTYVACDSDKTKTVVFYTTLSDDESENDYINSLEDTTYIAIDENKKIFSYQSVLIYLGDVDNGIGDNFFDDDQFQIYNGQKEVIKVLYSSYGNDPITGESLGPNTFFSGALNVLRSNLKDYYDVQITESKDGNPPLSGYDFYIFEHTTPAQLPTDGFVLLSDISSLPLSMGITLGSYFDYRKAPVPLTKVSDHELLNYMKIDSLSIGLIRNIVSYDGSYELLMSCDNYPAMLVCDQGASKVVIMPFSVHYSTIGNMQGFLVTLLYNMFNYFLPSTVDGDAFEVYESVNLTARGDSLEITGPNKLLLQITEFPATLSLDTPGTYTITQTTVFGKYLTVNVFVKIPALESNIRRVEDGLPDLVSEQKEEDYFGDLLLYLAAVLVGLLFVEWWLQSRENM